MIRPVIARRETTLHILKAFGIHMSKKLGQNFLIDEGVVAGIVAAADIQEGDHVLEIGPGIGTLTQALAEAGARVLAVELDRHLVEVLAETLRGYDQVRVVHDDILRLDIAREMAVPSFKVIANLPYYITTPILMHFMESQLPVSHLVTMVQKEVAERMAAPPGGKEYGALSVAVQYHSEPDLLFTVPPHAFIPSPAVESAVIRCVMRPEPPVAVREKKAFFRVVKAAFSQRRKTLGNALKAAGIGPDILLAAGVDGKRRGETLSLAEFAAIANVCSDRAARGGE